VIYLGVESVFRVQRVQSSSSEFGELQVRRVSEFLSSGKVVGVEEIWYPRKGTWSSPVTKVAVVMLAAEVL
jgi:hypothetical protein